MASLHPPANIDDFSRDPAGRGAELAELWESNVIGRFVMSATARSPNYYDPRVRPPGALGVVQVPWNGFPRALDRWHGVEADLRNEQARSAAEATADVLRAEAFWWEPVFDEQTGGFVAQLMTAFADQLDLLGLNPSVRAAIRPLRLANPDGSPGPEVPRLHRQQDEYLEWFAERDAEGRLDRISLTAEAPEYWRFLGRNAPELLLALYRELVGPEIVMEDLFFPAPVLVHGVDRNGIGRWLTLFEAGEYNESNVWNTTRGSVHLTQPANTLGAEVNLAADSSLAWASDDLEPDAEAGEDRDLFRCGCAGYGDINRRSDPTIGGAVGSQILAGNRISLTNPVALYITDLDLSSFVPPAGQPAPVVSFRGDTNASRPQILRVEIRPPEGTPYTLNQCTFEGRPLRRGGQIARKTTVALYAEAVAGGVDATRRPCRTRICSHPSRPEFRDLIPPSRSCDQVDWALVGPFQPVTSPGDGRMSVERAVRRGGALGGTLRGPIG